MQVRVFRYDDLERITAWVGMPDPIVDRFKGAVNSTDPKVTAHSILSTFSQYTEKKRPDTNAAYAIYYLALFMPKDLKDPTLRNGALGFAEISYENKALNVERISLERDSQHYSEMVQDPAFLEEVCSKARDILGLEVMQPR